MSVPEVAAVIGAGTMGPGMAAVLARAGSEVRLDDISAGVLDRARGGYEMATGALDRVEAASAPGGSVVLACAEQAAAGCAPLPDGEASADYLRHLVFVHARQALREAFTRAS